MWGPPARARGLIGEMGVVWDDEGGPISFVFGCFYRNLWWCFLISFGLGGNNFLLVWLLGVLFPIF
jgi:hypothetical protein